MKYSPQRDFESFVVFDFETTGIGKTEIVKQVAEEKDYLSKRVKSSVKSRKISC